MMSRDLALFLFAMLPIVVTFGLLLINESHGSFELSGKTEVFWLYMLLAFISISLVVFVIIFLV